jgi:hypothetical protein
MKLSNASRIPGWWQSMTGLPVTKLLDLLAEVDRMGASPNDRTVVERLWRERALRRALAHLRTGAPPATPTAGGEGR